MNSSRKTMFEDVTDFQELVLLAQKPDVPRLLDREAMEHLVNCMLEEVNELIEAYESHDLAGAVDALVDLIYFTLGGAYKMGAPFDEAWKIVHRANMTKKRGMTKRGKEDDATKPDGWTDPKIQLKELLNGPA